MSTHVHFERDSANRKPEKLHPFAKIAEKHEGVHTHLKGKNLLPKRNQFFSYKLSPCEKGSKNT